VDWLSLSDDKGPLPSAGADLEGVARTAAGELFVSSEGDVKAHLGPWGRDFAAPGRLRRRLPLPRAFRLGNRHGTFHNQGFEALTLAPRGEALVGRGAGPP